MAYDDVKFDTCLKLESISSLTRPAKKKRTKCEMESENELAIGDIQDISVESPEHR
jgi:hypothetical protein